MPDEHFPPKKPAVAVDAESPPSGSANEAVPPRELARRLNRIRHQATSVDGMVENVLREMLSIFGCDRAWLFYPCDPSAESWSVPWERTTPEWPGAHARAAEFPMTPEVRAVAREALAATGPLVYGGDGGRPVPASVADAFGVKGQMLAVIRPKLGKPWMLGIHHCAKAPRYSPELAQLLDEIGRHITDALSTVVTLRDLHTAEERYRLLFETMAQGVMYLDAKGRIIDTNPALERILGLSADEMHGRSCADPAWRVIREDGSELSGCERPSMRALETASPVKDLVMGVYNPRDEAYRWVMIDAVPQFREGKTSPCHVYTIFRDITERRQVQQALLKSQADLLEAQRIARLGSWHLDLVSNELNWSDEIYRIFGLEPQAFGATYEAFLDAIHPDDRDYVNQAYTDSLKTRQPYDIVHRLLMKDGSIKYVRECCETLFDESGRPLASTGTVQDITAQMQSDEKLRLSAAVVENTGEAIVMTDAERRIVAANKAYTRITGYSEQEVLGRNPRIVKSNRHDSAFYERMWASINAKGSWQGEIWNRRKGGEIFPAWATITAVRDDAGNVVNYVGVFSDISVVRQSQERLDYLAYHDPLTDLPNRLLFNDRLAHALQRAQRERQQLAVMFLDLDHFKRVNDSLGHPVGDELLQQVARRISGSVREEDTVARQGGDEFTILLEDVQGHQDVAVLARKLLACFSEPFQVAGIELQPTVSIGISLYPKDGADCAALIKNADAAMYRAKEEGRNDYQFYTAELTAAVFERLTLEMALRHALNHREFVLHYQPQYALFDGRLLGAEALVRWQHPELGLISPDKFIPLAEESGLIVPLGAWVLHEAGVQARAWCRAGLRIGHVAVNVSGRQFHQGQIVEDVKSVLADTVCSPACLELEITESVLMQEGESAVEILDELKALGVSVAIDDFGTGYSSLSYLKRLPVTKLKIDRSFVRDIPHDSNDEAITRAVIALAKSLRLVVTAEGIETEQQLSFLRSLGCDEGQGYYFQRPLPPMAFEDVLKDG